MINNKISTIFMVSTLILTGIGISYAGLTDTLNIYGTVTTGTVDLKIKSYSGTWAWKVYDTKNEIVITNDPTYSVPIEDGFLVSYAQGRPIKDGDPNGYDAVLEFSNLFPCIDFIADIVFHYDGTIPAKVSNIDWDWVGDSVTLPDGTVITDFIDWLWANGHMTGGFYRCNDGGTLFDPLEEVTIGYQLHRCNYFKLMVTIHLPQENWLQGLEGNGYIKIGVAQWNDQCEEKKPFDIEITKVTSFEEPIDEFTYTITAKNLGPGDVSDVIVNDLLPPILEYVDSVTSKGTYNPFTGDWVIGDLAKGETATLAINVFMYLTITPSWAFTQLALLIDGSGSISTTDWQIMLNGISQSIINNNIPHIGEEIELTIIQFGGWKNGRSWAQVELDGPITLNDTNYLNVANDILEISQLGGGTAMSCAFRLAADVLSGDPNGNLVGTPFEGMASTHSDWQRQVINLITDGQPNIIYVHEDRYAGSWPGSSPPGNEFVLGKNDTEAALGYYLSIIPLSIEDEIDSEAVGDDTDVPWLRDHVVRPQPGNLAPPYTPGWVIEVDDFTEFADTLKQKFRRIFPPFTNCAILNSPVDSNPDNNQACIMIKP